jgi:hypothetical protein
MTIRPDGLRAALNAEWSELADVWHPVPDAWRARPELAGCDSLADLLSRVTGQPDPVLLALLSRAVDGDLLAGRVVLQAMLGKLVLMAVRDPRAGLDDYVGAMWVRIRTYPVTTRPARVPANLALDTLKAVQRQVRSPAGVEVSPYPPSAFVQLLRQPSEEPVGNARQVIRTAARLGLITEDTAAVLTSVYADGLSGARAAARHHKSAGAIRFQCHKAVRVLAQHAELLTECA